MQRANSEQCMPIPHMQCFRPQSFPGQSPPHLPLVHFAIVDERIHCGLFVPNVATPSATARHHAAAAATAVH